MTFRGAAYPVQVGLLAGLYFGLAEAGLSAGALTGNVTPVWPPTGLALAALVLFGRRLWPGVALGALLVNGLSAVPLAVACGMAVGNTLEAVVGACLLGLVPGFRPALDRVADVVAVAVLAAGLSTAVSASVGVASLALGNVIAPGAFLATWRLPLGTLSGVVGLLRRDPGRQHRSSRSPAPTRQPARRHPARLLEERHPRRRSYRLAAPPRRRSRRRRLTNFQHGMSVCASAA